MEGVQITHFYKLKDWMENHRFQMFGAAEAEKLFSLILCNPELKALNLKGVRGGPQFLQPQFKVEKQ